MTVDELLKYATLMQSSGLGDRKILIFNNADERCLGEVKSWSIEDEGDTHHACALWIDAKEN